MQHQRQTTESKLLMLMYHLDQKTQKTGFEVKEAGTVMKFDFCNAMSYCIHRCVCRPLALTGVHDKACHD
jgi:hypothetical protein